MVSPESKRWVKFALVNLAIVACLGAIMRYKIGFSLPFFDQKFLQEAHSHFAFTGWITHTLFFLLVDLFRKNLPQIKENIYRRLLIINLFTAYGMLVSFAIQGYGPVSLTFSTISVLTGYVFSWFALKDAGRLPAEHPGRNWIISALWFGVISTFGTMVLSWMMATHNFNQTTYLGSIYFYLHFQYNGWFIFACFGIFLDRIKAFHLDANAVFYSFASIAIAAIPAYFLSTLWANLPNWLYGMVVGAAVLQLFGWIIFLLMIKKSMHLIRQAFSKFVLLLFLAVFMALSLKMLLQLGSTVPLISNLAFGFRPIVIAYLHLVLLLIVTTFLLAFMFGNGIIRNNRLAALAILVLVIGAILNEAVLAIQGIYSFDYIVIPHINLVLFIIAVILASSAIFLAASQLGKENADQHHPFL
jgi:hypothetical protein